MRLMEGMRLRVKDVEFDRQVVIVREAKGGKDRVVMLPRSLAPALRLHMLAARALWEADRQAQRGALRCRMLWMSNTPRWVTRGDGFGCFLPPRFPLTREAAWSTGTNCSKSGCSVP